MRCRIRLIRWRRGGSRRIWRFETRQKETSIELVRKLKGGDTKKVQPPYCFSYGIFVHVVAK